jgi:uncharacterized membrane protein YeiB
MTRLWSVGGCSGRREKRPVPSEGAAGASMGPRVPEHEPEPVGPGPVGRPRIVGVDLARGFALLGIMATHVFHTIGHDDGPAVVGPMRFDDCSAGTFALVAGVSLALASGGGQVLGRRDRAAAGADIAVQAVLIAVVGFALGFSAAVTVILSYYGMLLLFAIPLLGLRTWMLARIAIVAMIVAPLVVSATVASDAPSLEGNATFSALFADPSGVVTGLFVTGGYPVLTHLGYLCAGLAIGRMDLSSARLNLWLLFGGLALVAVVWAWWFVLPAPRAHDWIDLVRTVSSLGSAAAAVGAALLLVRSTAMALLLRPISATGTMALTLYSVYVLVLTSRVLENSPVEQYLVLLAGTLLFAVLWRRLLPQGPLEWLVAQFSRRARQAVLATGAGRPG